MSEHRTDWQRAIARHGRQDHPLEACGVIAAEDGALRAVRLANAHPDPERHFLLEPTKYLELYRAGVVRAYYHSHPEGPAEFSPSDRAFCDESGLPCYLYNVPTDELLAMTPLGWTQELEGRHFLPGVNDCYSLVRDFYARTLGLTEIPDPPRRAEWLQGGLPAELLTHILQEAGFVRVDRPQTYDLLLMDNGSVTGRPNHAAVMVEPGIILHQLVHTPSRRDVYGGHLADATLLVYRPPSKCSPPSTSMGNLAPPSGEPFGLYP